MIECYILRLFNISLGQIAILDLPPDKTLSVGMELIGKNTSLRWKIKGMGMPVQIDMLQEKIVPHYNSTRLWNCLMIPVDHAESLQNESVLTVATSTSFVGKKADG